MPQKQCNEPDCKAIARDNTGKCIAHGGGKRCIEIQEEIFKVLNQEIIDADYRCFTGRMNRVINCLNGFSPLVNINIKDGEQIGNIIILVKNKLELTGVYTIEQHKTEVEKELLERNYDAETIKTWLEYID